MAAPDNRPYFVITLRGERGPHSRTEVMELLRAGEIQGSDRLRNAFGRQLGLVEELEATSSSRRRPAEPPPAPRRNPTPITIAIIAVVVVIALLALGTGRSAPAPQPPQQPAAPVSISPPPPAPAPPTATPKQPGRLEGWTVTDIGGAVTPPEVEVRPGGRWWVASAGSDIWSASDQFRLVSRPLPRDGQVTARVHSATGQHGQAKSGVMLRTGIAPTAAFVLLSLSPGGSGELLMRARDGGLAESKPARHQGLPRWVRLQRIGQRIIPTTSHDGQTWQPAGDAVELRAQDQPLLAGVAVCSHERAVMTSVFSEVTVEQAP